jgi:GNAT superfamily N-acetyltransferase
MDRKTALRLLEERDIPVIYSSFEKAGWYRTPLLLENYLFEQEKGNRTVIVAYLKAEFAGYVTIKWKSDYPPFAEKGIPEIVDLNCLPAFQHRGIGTALMDKAEELIYRRSPIAGIGVGLFSDYGPAQRMYVLRGYVPDALGIAYKGQHVIRGQQVIVDDDLILYFTKEREKAV